MTKTELDRQAKKEAMIRGLKAETGIKEEAYDSEEDLQQMIEMNVDEMIQQSGQEGLTQAMEGVSLEGGNNAALGDKHPERRMKMLYKAYVEE